MSNTVTTINANAAAGSSNVNPDGSVKTVPAGGQTLTQADFLKIMVAQFTQQDPLSSGSGGSSGSGTSDYVNQLMSMTNLTTIQTMSTEQAQQLAASLPGETVTVSDNGQLGTGTVTSARLDHSTGAVFFTVGGTEYPSADLYAINQTPVATTPATTTPSTSH